MGYKEVPQGLRSSNSAHLLNASSVSGEGISTFVGSSFSVGCLVQCVPPFLFLGSTNHLLLGFLACSSVASSGFRIACPYFKVEGFSTGPNILFRIKGVERCEELRSQLSAPPDAIVTCVGRKAQLETTPNKASGCWAFRLCCLL